MPHLAGESSLPSGAGSSAQSRVTISSSSSTDASSSESRSAKTGKKRSRVDDDSSLSDNHDSKAPSFEAQSTAECLRARKRKRKERVVPVVSDDVTSATPVSLETEDISDEVRRRLQLKEERRRKRDARAEKRKRESLLSNASVSSAAAGVDNSKPSRKKPRLQPTPLSEGTTNEGRQRAPARAAEPKERKLEPDPDIDAEGATRRKRLRKERPSSAAP